MMNGLPSRCSSFWPMIRAISPVEPPGANGTTKVTGRLGYCAALSCPWAAPPSRHPASARTTAFIMDTPNAATLTRRNANETGVLRRELLRCNKRCRAPDWSRSTMRDYSPEELDVMAEAYDRLADRVPQISSPEITLRLVEEIALAVASGERDEAALADTALERANLAI